MRVFRTALVLLLVLGALAQQLCTGKMDYKLTITPKWSISTDTNFNRDWNKIGYVVSVVHSESGRIFKTNEPLREDVLQLVKENDFSPMQKRLEGAKKSRQNRVHYFDYVRKSGGNAVIYLNVKMDADASNTHFSVIGVLLGTPDSFFGIYNMNLCKNGNWTVKYPEGNSDVWVRGYDAGFNAATQPSPDRTNLIPESRKTGVQVESRQGLQSREHYATYKLERGSFDNYLAFWKILVIVGVLATLLLIAFICLYPICCKKQMLDVPVPLENEHQYST